MPLILPLACTGAAEKSWSDTTVARVDTGATTPGDTDTEDTGGSLDTDTVDTDTVDTDTAPEPDTEDSAGDTAACDPSPYVTREAWDTGEPAAVAFLGDTGATFNARWNDTGDVDCDASVQSANGDPWLPCILGTNFELNQDQDEYDGGEEWVRRGGGLEGATDRVERPSYANTGWYAYAGDITATDLDGDGMADLAIGGDEGGVESLDTAHVDILLGSAGGLRGVHRYEETFDLSLVVGPDAGGAFSALGRGDFDGDGLDDLLLPWRRRGERYYDDGSVAYTYPDVNVGLLYGSELLPYLQ